MKSLVRWQPFQEFSSLQRQMNRMFDNFFGRTTSLMPFEENLSDWEFGPPVDIYEDDQRLAFKVEVPGIDEKDIKVEVENNVLSVHGERKLEKDVKEENFRRMEREYGAFSRSFTLPSTVDPEKIEANYSHGILSIQMPKRAEAKPKQIKVNVPKTLKAA
ncbi:MAG TPA: Hsp20/alpha crystallin family protein [Candidatus Bathyarchaeia archaeon]|nr:Hsp20/alpha crystallin family protein [Candidatus Bathyarchaeia archaeon]